MCTFGRQSTAIEEREEEGRRGGGSVGPLTSDANRLQAIVAEKE